MGPFSSIRTPFGGSFLRYRNQTVSSVMLNEIFGDRTQESCVYLTGVSRYGDAPGPTVTEMIRGMSDRTL